LASRRGEVAVGNLADKHIGFGELGGTLIPLAYDWRLDIRTSAATLHARLSQPDLAGKRIAIVAHSMGGLVTRCALEKIGIPESLRLELVALVASPHLGAPVALQNLLGLRPEKFLSASQLSAGRDCEIRSFLRLINSFRALVCPRFSLRTRSLGF
jgi:pimeloyl-ACP methyl ester carboxylesterase